MNTLFQRFPFLLNPILPQNLIIQSISLYILSHGLDLCKTIITKLFQKIKNQIFVTLEIHSRDDSFSSITEWLNAQESTKHSSQLVVETTYDPDDKESKPLVLFTPSCQEDHVFVFNGKWVWMKRERESLDISVGGPTETITLSAIGRQKNLFRDLVHEAIEYNHNKVKGKTVIYTCVKGQWRKIGLPESARPIDSVVLNTQLKQDILEDIKKFLKNKDWYKSLGIPYRRGYLFYGPPGCGKSSFIKALAGYFGLDICLLNLSNSNVIDEHLSFLFNGAPRKCIIVIEDIDVAMPKREQNEHSDGPNTNIGLTLSGLLNAIDGIAGQEGRLLFMTTNSLTELDPALKRPGRVDRSAHFGLITKPQLVLIFQNFYRNFSTAEYLSNQFSEKIPENRFSVAEIQKYLMFYQEDPNEALHKANQLEHIISDIPTIGELEKKV